MADPAWKTVLERYPLGRWGEFAAAVPSPGPLDLAASKNPQAVSVRHLGGAGGFSGAEFWKVFLPASVDAATGCGAPAAAISFATEAPPARAGTPTEFCLRAWPPEADPAQLAFIHAVLHAARQRGISYIPVPLPVMAGPTFTQHAGRYWELAPWMPGAPIAVVVPHRSIVSQHAGSLLCTSITAGVTPALLRAAIQALARFHVAVADFPRAEGQARRPSRIVAQRLTELRSLIAGAAERIRQDLGAVAGWSSEDATALAKLGLELLQRFDRHGPGLLPKLAAAATWEASVQPIIRDVWSDHVLFTGERVTGLVDFGGMTVDTPAADVARLLGSLARDDASLWHAGLAAYSDIRPLNDTERQLVALCDRSAVLMTGLTWLRWIVLEGRNFSDRAAVLQRMEMALERLRAAERSPGWMP